MWCLLSLPRSTSGRTHRTPAIMTVDTDLISASSITENDRRRMDLGTRNLRRQIRCCFSAVGSLCLRLKPLYIFHCSSIVVDTLLKNSFKPTRTVVLAFGIDEESAGTEVRLPAEVFNPTTLARHRALATWQNTLRKRTAETALRRCSTRAVRPSALPPLSDTHPYPSADRWLRHDNGRGPALCRPRDW